MSVGPKTTIKRSCADCEVCQLLTECRDCVASDINYTLTQFHNPAAVDYLHALLWQCMEELRQEIGNGESCDAV